MSHSKRALRLALLPLHEKNKPIYPSTLRFSTVTSPTTPTLPPLISPLSLEPTLTPLTLQQPGAAISSSGTIRYESPKPPPLSPQPRFRQKRHRTKKIPTLTAAAGGPRPAYPLPTKWRCHTCGRKYAIGVTRRCLIDGHFLCFPMPMDNPQSDLKQMKDQPRIGGAKVAVEEGRNEKARAVIALRQTMKARSRLFMKANRISKGYVVKFDYKGWSAYGAWKGKDSFHPIAQPHTYPTTAHTTASTPITAANNPPATLISAAPPVDVAVSAFPVDVGADGVVPLPPVAAAGVGVALGGHRRALDLSPTGNGADKAGTVGRLHDYTMRNLAVIAADADLKVVAITETLLFGKEVVGGGAVGHADLIEEVVLLAGEGRVSQSGDKRIIGFVA
ncbi:hypothetical protein V501_07917 [Pseudogymnoascus sp. VKM F-4519 (FW-2642)]|nr:hypothetical protein V501_07917 [Pseudogymnoascus sp. VKM F-4519 (FW-2642)]